MEKQRKFAEMEIWVLFCLTPRHRGALARAAALARRGAGVYGRHVAASRIKACAAGLKGHGPRGLYSEGEFRVLRLGNRVLMSGIIMATLISVERSPRHLFMDLNPIRPVLTRSQFYMTRWMHALDYWRTVLGI